MTDAEYLAQLEAMLTPDLTDAIDALLNATPKPAKPKSLHLHVIGFPRCTRSTGRLFTISAFST
jgi:hypothetical protein